MSHNPRPVVGIFGAGKFGVTLARLATAAGYTVHMASSGTVTHTAAITRYFAPGAIPTTAHDLPARADILVIAVPLDRFRELPLNAMGDHIVVDVMNYWPPINGVMPEFDNTDRPSSTVVRDALPSTARLVKTLNHLGYHQTDELARPAGSAERTALALAGDDPHAVETVASLIDDLGFDPVLAGTLDRSGAFEPESAVFGHPLGQDQMHRALAIERAA